MKRPAQRDVLAATATFLFAGAVGAAGGVIAFGFQSLVEFAQRVFLGSGASAGSSESGASILQVARTLAWWQCLALPAAGGLLAALVIRWLAPKSEPFGIPGIMEAVSVRRRRIKSRPIVVRALASVAVISTGGSVGREGPIVQLGAALASKFARFARFDPRRHSLLLGCGVAAGMAAAYNAPLAGAFFVMEVILASFAIEIFAPLVVSSVFSAIVMRALRGGDAAVYAMPEGIEMTGLASIVLALVLGIPGGVVAVGFQRLLQVATHRLARIRVPLEAKLALGGLAVGAIGMRWPEVFGNGYSATSEILAGRLAITSVAALLFLKPLATTISVGSGAPGGVFTPALLTGAALGALFASSVGALFPSIQQAPAAFVVVGMAALIAGVTHAPIMSMVLLVELTHDLGLVLPLTLATVASALTARFLARDSIFTESLRARGVPIDMGIEELTLRRIRVRDLVRSGLASLRVNTPLDAVLERFRETRLDVIYVTDGDGSFCGSIDLHDVKDLLNREQLGAVVIAADVLEMPPVVSPEMSLAEVLEIFGDPEREEVPVVEKRGDKRVLVGRLTRRDVIAALNLEVLKHQTRRTRLFVSGTREPNWVELPNSYQIAELEVPQHLRRGTLKASGLADEKGITVLSLVERLPGGDSRKTAADPEAELGRVSALVVMGRPADIDALRTRTEPKEKV